MPRRPIFVLLAVLLLLFAAAVTPVMWAALPVAAFCCVPVLLVRRVRFTGSFAFPALDFAACAAAPRAPPF